VAPCLTVSDADAAIAFYLQVFGATETVRNATAGRVGHAELLLGGAPLMLSDEFPEMQVRGPHMIGGSPVCLVLYIDDVDSVVARLLAPAQR
jgi:PhnB protein